MILRVKTPMHSETLRIHLSKVDWIECTPTNPDGTVYECIEHVIPEEDFTYLLDDIEVAGWEID